MSKLTTQELVDLFYQKQAEGEKMPTITFASPVFEEAYLDTGMKANLVDVKIEGKYEHDEIVYGLFFEWNDFVEENIKKEKADWYDKNGFPCLTASESGNRPLNNRETVYSGSYHPDSLFIIDEEENYTHVLDKETHKTIIEALLMQKGILAMRIAEALDANDVKNHKDAKDALTTVNRALKQLRYKEDN